MTGIEPASSVWKTEALPLSYIPADSASTNLGPLSPATGPGVVPGAALAGFGTGVFPLPPKPCKIFEQHRSVSVSRQTKLTNHPVVDLVGLEPTTSAVQKQRSPR